ncbi:hypothetical protein AYO47_06160 [Planctomyces sp. SCGC AG-212-M04]|nr:hypothetical protein AYO47_06160 [Planctomyces sp. SCGC AG-212-M04]
MSPRLTRLELALVAAIFAIGLGLRAAYPSRMAVEHFDEGVYASNLYTPEGRYPFQHLYAPPLLPFCLEWAAIFGGPPAVMWVNVFSGSLTLLVLWGMVRQWWGPPSAIAAMVLLAFNEFHIAYSRAALTDAMLGLWMTAGVWAGWRAIQLGGPVNIAAAGVLASLAWWTKYNGWLTLAITGSGTAGWILFGGGRSGAPKTDTVFGAAGVYLGRWGMTAAIAFLLWSPWLWELQQYGGYSAVAKNHAQYFTGLGQWTENAVRQLSAWASYHHIWTTLGLAIAGIAQSFLHSSRDQLPLSARSKVAWTLPQVISTSPFWVLLAWVCGMSVAVPLYTAYPRLSLPWVIATPTFVIAMLVAGGFSPSADHERSAQSESVTKRRLILYVALGVFVVFSIGDNFRRDLLRFGVGVQWEDRRSLSFVADQILARLQSQSLTREVDGARCIVAVVAEPGLFFHLSAAQRSSPVGHVALPAADFSVAKPGSNTSELPVYLVAGPHADHSEADRLIAEGRLEQVTEFEYRPSHLVLLDSRPAWDLPPKDKPVVERVRLLHVKP